MAYDLKHTGEAIDAAIYAVERGSVVTNNTVPSITPGEAKPASADAIAKELQKKVDKVEGKGLSTNDYTNEDKVVVGSVSKDILPMVGGKVLIEGVNAYAPFCEGLILRKGQKITNNGVPILVSKDRELTGRIDIDSGATIVLPYDIKRLQTLKTSGTVDLDISPYFATITMENLQDKSVDIEKLSFASSVNLIDPSSPDWVNGAYINIKQPSGLSSSPTYNTTGFIPIEVGKTYQMRSSKDMSDSISARFVAFYGEDKKPIGAALESVKECVAPSDAVYMRASYLASHIGKDVMQITQSEAPLPYKDYTIEIPSKYLEIPKTNITFGAFGASGTILPSETLVTDSINICKNILISAVIEGSVESIIVGVGRGGYYGKNIVIKATEIVLHSGSDNAIVGTYQHGLTLDEHTIVTIDKGNDEIAKIRIVNSKGDVFEQNVTWSTSVGQPFIQNGGTNAVEAMLRMMPRDIIKKIWMFGDSYFGMYSPYRWLYYMLQRGYNQYLVDAKGGENATEGISDLNALLALGAYPSYILWAHGMNGGKDTDDGAVNSSWLSATKAFLAACDSYNITPILATIPSVPSQEHTALNEWVRNSGYRYVDFAKVVEDDDSKYWKGWGTTDALLDTDEVHPSVKGASILTTQVLIDFPEISLE